MRNDDENLEYFIVESRLASLVINFDCLGCSRKEEIPPLKLECKVSLVAL